jgi:aminopeptidase-like protein
MELLNKLYNLKRTLISDDNKKAMDIINNIIPLKIYNFKSGTKCYDWVIPPKWVVNRGTLKDLKGNKIIDCKDNILHLVNYSNSYKGEISKKQLLNNIYTDENQPNAVPYRTSYYSNNWGFCLSYNKLKTLKDEKYTVDINTKFIPGELLIGEATLKGKSKKEIILTSYYCHPNQINDGLSGVDLLVKLYNKIKSMDLYYTYRFFFWPETIGAITALSQKLINPNNVEYAMVATTVGRGEPHYKKTFLNNHSLDNIISNFVTNQRSYSPTGSDERQFSSSGIRIPTGVLTTIPYEEFPEYHTSQDNLTFISEETISKMVDLYMKIILEYEKYPKYKVNVKGGEPFLSKYKLYREVGVPGNTENDTIRNWVLHYCDGTKNIKDISKLLNISENIISKHINILKNKKVIYEDLC